MNTQDRIDELQEKRHDFILNESVFADDNPSWGEVAAAQAEAEARWNETEDGKELATLLMNNHQKYDLACRQFGSLQNPNPPMRVDWMTSLAWHILFDRDNLEGTCLVYLHAENGIGIADRDKRGYTPTPCIISEGVDGKAAVTWFNQNILGLSELEAAKIVTSTMRGKIKAR